jgi:peptide/nickel transport system permease protein
MWLGLVLSFLFAFTFRIFPLQGGYGFNLEPTLSWTFFQDLAWHWVLPFLSLFLVQFGGWAIGMRNMIIYELESDYSRYLEALGAPQKLVRKYAFRNAMLPQITGLALQLGVIVAGALVTEIVFSYPGLGRLVFNAIQSGDYFLLQGIFLFIIVGVLLANFIVDIVYVIVDPRTRVAMRGGTA